MNKYVIRLLLIAVLLGIALASVEVGPKTYSQHKEEIELVSFAWGVSASQFTRICTGNGVGAADTGVTEEVALSFGVIKFESGETVHETVLQVPFGQTRCADFTYPNLVAAGLVPESNSAIQFFIVISKRSSARTVGATQSITVGAAQNVDVGTGEIKLYQPFRIHQTRQATIIQDI